MNSLLYLTVILMLLAGCASTQSEAQRATAVDGGNQMQNYVYFIHPQREGFIDSPTEAEQARIGEHFQYLKSLTEQGVVLLAGPSTDPPYTGIIIFRAENRQRAEEIMNGDPAVQAGVFEARLSPMRLSLVGDL